MNRFSQESLKSLLLPQNGPCVSLYLELKQPYWSPRNLVRYRRLLKAAEQELLMRYSKADTFRILSPIRFFSSLHRDLKDANTVCFFSSGSTHGFFPIKKPIKNTVIVAPSFHIKPILSYLNPMHAWLGVHIADSHIEFVKGQNEHMEPVRRVSREKWRRNPWNSYGADLIGHWISLQRKSRYIPVFIYGSEAVLSEFEFEGDFNLLEISEQNECELLVPSLVSQRLSLIHQTKLSCLNQLILRHETVSDLNKIAKLLEDGRLESLAVRIDNTRWGQIDWQCGVVKLSENGAMLDCVLDDLAERALVKGVDLLLCQSADLITSADAVGVLKRKKTLETTITLRASNRDLGGLERRLEHSFQPAI